MGEAASLRLEGALNLSVLRKKSPYSFLAWLDKCALYFFYLEFLVSCDCQITKLQTFDTVLHFFLTTLKCQIWDFPNSPCAFLCPLGTRASVSSAAPWAQSCITPPAQIPARLPPSPLVAPERWQLVLLCGGCTHWFHQGSLQRYQIFQSENKLAHNS